jgi:hypothetical protein
MVQPTASIAVPYLITELTSIVRRLLALPNGWRAVTALLPFLHLAVEQQKLALPSSFLEVMAGNIADLTTYSSQQRHSGNKRLGWKQPSRFYTNALRVLSTVGER